MADSNRCQGNSHVGESQEFLQSWKNGYSLLKFNWEKKHAEQLHAHN